MFNTLFLNRAFYEIICKTFAVPNKPQMKIWRMRIDCWIFKTAVTHSEYVILIAFPQQHWLNERASM
jgi:hypothetical protein